MQFRAIATTDLEQRLVNRKNSWQKQQWKQRSILKKCSGSSFAS